MTYGISNFYNNYSKYGLYNVYNSYKNSQQSVSNSSWQSGYQSALKGQYSVAIDETRDYASALQKSAEKLQVTSKGDVFEGKSIVSSNPGVITSNKVSNNAVNKSYDLEVMQLAEAQKNVGSALNSNSLSEFKLGKNEFSILSGDKTYNLSINVNASDTNKEVLNKMVRVINDADMDINASLINNSGKSQIELTGINTGLGNEFSIIDKNNNDLIAKTGANKVNIMTQDAIYSVNGLQHTSDSNIISLQSNKVNVELKEETTDKVNIKVGQDTKAVKEGINAFVKDYNTLINSLQDNSGLVNKSLLNNLTNAATGKKYSLKEIGITIGSDQTLSIDNDKLTEALQNDSEKVQKVIGGYNGLADKTESIAKGITKSSVAKLTGSYSAWTGSTSGIVNTLDLKNEQFKLYQQMSQYSQKNSILNMFNMTGSGNFVDWYF